MTRPAEPTVAGAALPAAERVDGVSGRPAPVDAARLVADLRALGVPRRDLLVHVSLRRVGPPLGGPATLYEALRTVLGPRPTVVVPTHTTDNSVTSRRYRAATLGMTAAQRAAHEARMEGYHPAMPSQGCGAFAEYLRQRPDAVRSAHPQTSFAACGPGAAALLAVHDLGCHVGDRSPVGALYRADGSTLLLGVGYDACTSLHLAEYRLWPPVPVVAYRCFTREGDRRVRHDFLAPRLDDRDFVALGAVIDAELGVPVGRVGHAEARIVPIRPAVEVARAWLTRHRKL